MINKLLLKDRRDRRTRRREKLYAKKLIVRLTEQRTLSGDEWAILLIVHPEYKDDCDWFCLKEKHWKKVGELQEELTKFVNDHMSKYLLMSEINR